MNKIFHLVYHGKLSFRILIKNFIVDIKWKVKLDLEEFVVHPTYV